MSRAWQVTGDAFIALACALLLLVAAVLLSALLSSCAALTAAKPAACAVVSALDSACTLVTFLGDDGKIHTVPCTAAEVTAWGKDVEARHLAAARSVR